MRWNFFLSLVFTVAVWFSLVRATVAQQPVSANAEIRKKFQTIASRFELKANGKNGAKYKLLESSILNWTNPQRRTEASALFIWTRANRPKAALCIYPDGSSHFNLEFQSLSTEPLMASTGGSLLWEPINPGVRFQVAEEASVPSENALVRLRQMRMLAREYIATLSPMGSQPERLRLLPSPIYRYPAKGLNPQIIDGAMFAFAVGTDPEVLLLIESTKETSKAPLWQVAFARMTVVPSQVHRNNKLVWEPDPVSTNRYESYYVIKSIERDNAVIKKFD